MKTVLAFIVGSLFTVALLVTCGSGTQNASAAGGNWEYSAIDSYSGALVMPTGVTAPDVSACPSSGDGQAPRATCILNALGANGWQLIGTVSSQYGTGDFYLGRPK